MRNNFNITVNFNSSPKMPYEWDNSSNITNIKLERVSTEMLKNILTYEGLIHDKAGVILISDTKNAVALKLDNKGKILKRSFLDFEKCLDVCEFACNLRESKLNFEKAEKKVVYSKDLSIEQEMKDYILKSIKKSRDEDLIKYLYYLYFEEVENYSKDKLIKFVKSSNIEKNLKAYNFLTCTTN